MEEGYWRRWRVWRAEYEEGFAARAEVENDHQMYLWVAFDQEAVVEKVSQAARVHRSEPGIDEIRYHLLVNLLHVDKTWENGRFPVHELDLAEEELAWCARFGIKEMCGAEDEDSLTDAMLVVTERATWIDFNPFHSSAKAHVLWRGHALEFSNLHYDCKPSSHDGSWLTRRR